MDSASPIPPPIQDDDEDVHWALSTASALWGRGERVEALKWLRRAAEQASDVNADNRALQLFKAAAELANEVKAGSMFPAAPPSVAVAAAAPSGYPVAMDRPPSSFPPPPPRAPAPAPSSFPPPPPAAGVPRPAPGALPPPPPPRKKGAPPSVPAPPMARPPSVPAPPFPQRPLPVPPAPRPIARTEAGIAPSPPAAPVPARPIAVRPPAALEPARAPAPRGNVQAQPARPGLGRVPDAEASKPFELQIKRASGPQSGGSPAKERKRTLNEKRRAALQQQPPAPPPPPAEPEIGALDGGVTERPPAPPYDDLDDVTRVLDNNPALKAPNVPGVATARKGTVQQIDDDFRRMLGSRPSLTDEVSFTDEDADERTDARIPPMLIEEPPTVAAPEPKPPAASPKEAAPVPAPPPTTPALPPEPAPVEATSRKVAPLLSFRVAILGTGTPGEVRLLALDHTGAPPEGAAQAILVPLGAADGELVAKLFGSLE